MNEKVNAYITSTKIRLTHSQKKSLKIEAVVTSKNRENEIVEKADKSRSIPVTYIYNKIT